MKKQGVFIITGATGGLGRAVAETVYALNFPLALIARTKSDLQRLQKELRLKYTDGAQISIHAVDLTNEENVIKEINDVLKTHGNVRALINNAATWMGSTSIEKLKSCDIKKSLDLNFFSAFNITAALLRKCGKKPIKDLAIINIGATASMDAWVEVLPFCIAKGALRNFSRALARDLGPKGVHVAHLVIDGMLDNERTQKLNPSMPKDRFINTKSVAETILHVALQDRSCFTMELDVRPHNENW